ncbi:dTMP kinase [Candidatus Borrarchaeum sp.]|uniref:dTMP kinase n=1 Tax=Candidatus Borrarchaeum sp. TaxID=2846742 RepID=UPI00257C0913|nr:dTMP kinase [Candidatus Borrarchaeum sp.]
MTNPQSNQRGFLIAFEGIDGSGTSTHSRLLYEFLVEQGFSVILTREPTKGAVGRLIKEALQDKFEIKQPEMFALLFAADRIQHVKEVIEPALKQGQIVITTRYIESSLAYQSAQELTREWIKAINKGIVWPDITFILDISPKDAMARLNRREKLESFENREFLSKVRDNFLERAKEEEYSVIDTTQSIQKSQEIIQDISINFFGKHHKK